MPVCDRAGNSTEFIEFALTLTLEALTAASTAALTVYDMMKAVDKGITIVSIQLEEKQGGKSGTWRRSAL